MRYYQMFSTVLYIGLVLLSWPVSGQPAKDLHAGEEARCLNCHSCARPTHDSPCLRACERSPEVAEIPADTTGVADVLYLDKLVGLYEPVTFPHKLHADMEAMGAGCAVCHHHNPPGRILSCGECHGGPSNPANLGQPGLKGAYHRQCLGCHREWSHKTDCKVCHNKRSNGELVAGATSVVTATQEDVTDIIGQLHPNIETPEKWVYQTEEMSDGPIVTFHHKEHVDLFGLKCVDCHKKESCSRCHDPQSHPLRVKEDPHEDCIRCHDVSDNCTLCHAAQETKGFNHAARTGFVIKPFHQQLACASCHKGGMPFKKVDSTCQSCHEAGWFPQAFDHTRAGLELDEMHKEAGCTDCHTEGLGKPSTCTGCHDDGRKFPDQLPGKVVPQP